MVTLVFLNNCVVKGGFGPGTILRRIKYHRKSRDKILLKLVHFFTLMPLVTARPFFIFAKMLYVHFVPAGNHSAIAFYSMIEKKVKKKVRLTFSPFWNKKR
jgi:hypothetical protein